MITTCRRPPAATFEPKMLGVPLSELLLLAALIIVAGVVTGILAGLFGIGGGALIVPVLYEVFRVLGVPDEVRFQPASGPRSRSSCRPTCSPSASTATRAR